MIRSRSRRPAAPFLVMVLVSLLVPPATIGGARQTVETSPASPSETVDLASGLAGDGTFLGVPGAGGTVDASAWTLVSDLSAGEPPRFQPASDGAAPRASRDDDAFTGSLVSSDGVEWLGLGANGAVNGALGSQVRAMAVQGGALYVGGLFTDAAGIAEADYVARWVGGTWSAMGSNGAGVGALNAFVNALGVTSGSVFVGGNFTNAAGIATADYLAVWNGSGWSALGGTGNGALNSTVNALAVVGGQVYAAGFFSDAGGVATADYVAHWTGSVWTALGSNGSGNGALNTFVYALATSGSDLYVGGTFTNAATIPAADRVASWNFIDATWSALGSNQAGTDGAIVAAPDYVVALAASGSNVYVGGNFLDAAGIATADHVARWNGTEWSGLGSNGAGTNGALNDQVRALAVSGTTVYVGGLFTDAAGNPTADYVARWSGSAWSALGSDAGGSSAVQQSVFALTASGSAIYVGGNFINAAGIPDADHIALALVPGPWSAVGPNGAVGALNGPAGPGSPTVRALAVSGSDLYVGGNFANAGGIAAADFVARWDGRAWSALGGLNGPVLALAVSGSDVFVGGTFTNVAGIPTADFVARWNGTAWSALGSNPAGTNGALGYWDPTTTAGVAALAASGSDLYVGGLFTNTAGIATADFVARWNGTAWSALGSNAMGTDGAVNSTVRALTASGANLFVGGDFLNAGGDQAADGIAKWSGSAWSALGSNGAGNGALNSPGRVGALALSGSILYVGGNFVDAAGIPEADYIARWNGSAWSALGSSETAAKGALNNGVPALVISGGHLFAGGGFTNAAGLSEADYIARWNGNAWSALGSNGAGNGALSEIVNVLAVSANKLVVGGEFFNAAGIPTADLVAAFGPIATHRPDARIRKGSGSYVGNNIYNTDGTNQSKSGKAARGSTITFTIAVQNDGSGAEHFRVHATGAATTMYGVRYFRGTTEITAAVVAGTYQTPSLAVGAKYLITAKVKVKSTATVGSLVTRLVTSTSVADPTRRDAVKFTGKRG